MPVTKLEKLLISEISGVDEPANLLDGWMILKARGAHAAPGDYAALLKTELGLASVLHNINVVAAHEGVSPEVVRKAKNEALATALVTAYQLRADADPASGSPARISTPTERLRDLIFGR